MSILFLASTPLHTFFALGLMRGPYRDRAHTLAMIDQPPGVRDYIADALQADPEQAVAVVRFPALRSGVPARSLLAQVSSFAARLAPSTIAVGNDHRLEFHAAVRGCPSARRTYIDDGLYSYLPHPDAKPAWRERLSNWRRGVKYGLTVERPRWVGGSSAVQDAYVLLPPQVHPGLAGKPVQALQRAWFADPWVAAICASAAALAGVDAQRCASIRLLVLLPHPGFLRAEPALARRIEALVHARLGRGEAVALKSHPNAGGVPAGEQLRVPADRIVELPARLPVEVLAPLLPAGDTLIVGTLTTALLTLVLLGRGARVRSLVSQTSRGYNQRAMAIYASVGIRPLEDETATANDVASRPADEGKPA